MKIDFFTTLGKGSEDYAEFLKYTCEKFHSGIHEIGWKSVEFAGSSAPSRIINGFECVDVGEDLGHSSVSHSTTLNLIQKHVDADYVIISDADVAVLYPGWDDVVIKELSKYDCFGGGYAHGSRYKNFPAVYFFAFKSSILNNIVLDFSPVIDKDGQKIYKRPIKTKEESSIFGIDIGGTIKCDTGWKIPSIIKKAGLTYNAMPMVLTTDRNAILPFKNEEQRKFCFQKPSHMHEWHYNNKLFATHKQAARSHPLYTSEWGSTWKKRVDMYIVNGGY